jgi:hypothetical protein
MSPEAGIGGELDYRLKCQGISDPRIHLEARVRPSPGDGIA